MTSVWRGHDRVLGRDVIVKVLHPELAAHQGVRARFQQEAVNAARLTHPNIVAVYDTGQQQGVTYLVMELVDLKRRVRRRRARGVRRLLDIEQRPASWS